MAHKSNLAIDESISDDDIASESSSSTQEAEYNVEEILAERPCDDSSPRFLVRWENYPDERCDSGTLVAPSNVGPLIPFSSPC
jgi:Chromo (CHRromatin Organisation MOdifier) domain